jgi:hypothetical protein
MLQGMKRPTFIVTSLRGPGTAPEQAGVPETIETTPGGSTPGGRADTDEGPRIN